MLRRSRSPGTGQPSGQTRHVRQKRPPPSQKKEKPFPQMHLEHLPKSPPASSIHLPCSPRVNPDVSLTGRIRARERVHSVVTSTRCAPLTQNTQPVDMPHRHHTDPPHNQGHTCFHSHSGLGALHGRQLSPHVSFLFLSPFSAPSLSLYFFLSVKLISKVFTLGANKKLEQIYSLEHDS